MEHKPFFVRRSGKKDRKMYGALLVRVATCRDDTGQHRGYEITLYARPDGTHVVQWIYTRTYSGPVTKADYTEAASLFDALEAIERFAAKKWVPHSGNVLDFTGARMQIAVQMEYDELISTVYRELDMVE